MRETMGPPVGPTMLLCYAAITGITGAATTFSATPVGTSAAISYAINGKTYTKATITGGATPTTDGNTGAAFVALAASQACAVVLALDKDGNVKGYQGNIVNLDSGGGYGNGYPEFPTLPSTVAPFAYIVCKNGSTGSAWTFGSSNWNAAGMTPSAQAICALPARPQSS